MFISDYYFYIKEKLIFDFSFTFLMKLLIKVQKYFSTIKG